MYRGNRKTIILKTWHNLKLWRILNKNSNNYCMNPNRLGVKVPCQPISVWKFVFWSETDNKLFCFKFEKFKEQIWSLYLDQIYLGLYFFLFLEFYCLMGWNKTKQKVIIIFIISKLFKICQCEKKKDFRVELTICVIESIE